MERSITALLIAVAALAGPVACTSAADAPKAGDAPKVADAPKAAATVTKPYPMNTCVVSGDEFGGEMGEPIVKVYDGREMKFCCKSCIPKYEKNPARYNATLDEAAKASTDAKTPAAAHDEHRAK